MESVEKMILKQAYNNHAEHRDRSGIEPWKWEERERFLLQAKQEGRESVLEIGAGPGRDSLYLQSQGLDVTSTDLSEEMIRLCREKGLRARVMDFYELDFPDASFDAVFALNCLLHVPKAKLDGVLREIRRVLKPNGLFFCGVYGGEESEGIWEKDDYEPKRFFAMYEDEAIQRIAQGQFGLEDFHTVEMGPGRPHFQSMLLRKTS
ncbi:class I SAM-dependent methyltransferase [Cohnella lubricantis]|uniref:Class I SAM-dependent methyltransferase n=1 Tax=Cohnella lubricantis TaxID=2163172 RepID=A0A841TB78_9BACL|nr:class I SAM-dependent methyltransferase [Cohnella lubricantis]MBB6678554.1 class I SAM-dependent methyltransferase [Cohnella lubricantis]MBP2119137.1 SAM-dependent methyltransferase [Cohnella lubricantis]